MAFTTRPLHQFRLRSKRTLNTAADSEQQADSRQTTTNGAERRSEWGGSPREPRGRGKSRGGQRQFSVYITARVHYIKVARRQPGDTTRRRYDIVQSIMSK